MLNKKMIAVLVASVSMLTFSGCVSTTQKLIKKSDLETSTQMSATVWLDPVASEKRTAFLQIRNTSDVQLDMQSSIARALESKGYTITQDPDKAHYWVQANILKVGKTDLDESKGFLENGYGNAIIGGTIGSQLGGGNGQVAFGVGGAILGAAADAIWEDILYTMVTDLQISEKAEGGVEVHETNTQSLVQGTSGAKVQTSNEVLNRKKYQTRIVSTATKVNLTMEEAIPSLKNGLVKSISGIL